MNALLEIGVEHLPARFMAPALKQLKTLKLFLLSHKSNKKQEWKW